MGGGKGGTKPIYTPKYSGQAEDFLFKTAMGTAQKRGQGGMQPGGGKGSPSPGHGGLPSPSSVSSGSSGDQGMWTAGNANTYRQKARAGEYQQFRGGAPSSGFGQGSQGGDDYSSYGLNLPQTDYAGMMQNLQSGRGAFGQNIPQYQGYNAFQFSKPYDIKSGTDQAYNRAREQAFTGIQQAQKLAGAQAGQAMASRGLGRGGLAGGAQAGLARQAMEQMAQAGTGLGLQQAQEQLQNERLLAQLFPQIEQQQASQNLAAAQQQLQAQQTLSDMDLRRAGAYGTFAQQAQAEEMLPYQMLSQLYGTNVGISPGQAGSKGSPLSALLGAGATLATGGAAAPALAAGAAGLGGGKG